MSQSPVFDRYGSISERRKEFLEWLLPELKGDQALKSALDVGCGVGYFSHFLRGRGLSVTGLDARADNIAEAKKRYPEIPFHVRNVEDPGVPELGTWDMVLCFGLLYHLENPFRAIRNLHALTKQFAVIESMVMPHQSPVAALIDEVSGEDQGLAYVAFVPSESCLVKMLYRAGFAAVYKPVRMPEHEDFRASLACRRRRTVLVASKSEIASPALVPLVEQHLVDLWKKKWANAASRVVRFIRKPMPEKMATLKNYGRRW